MIKQISKVSIGIFVGDLQPIAFKYRAGVYIVVCLMMIGIALNIPISQFSSGRRGEEGGKDDGDITLLEFWVADQGIAVVFRSNTIFLFSPGFHGG